MGPYSEVPYPEGGIETWALDAEHANYLESKALCWVGVAAAEVVTALAVVGRSYHLRKQEMQ